jgi:riboflavin synthase
MFTGIVEEVGEVMEVRTSGANVDLIIRARMAPELKVDQSVAHNGACLTVVEVPTVPDRTADRYCVTAVEETLRRSNIGSLKPGDGVNLERSLRIGGRLDGHMVQGHVDTTVQCINVEAHDGSWTYSFMLPDERALLVEKGSVCLNGVSLTIASLDDRSFDVAVIPYTHAHTTFREIRKDASVNVEFDVVGKYVARMLAVRA